MIKYFIGCSIIFICNAWAYGADNRDRLVPKIPLTKWEQVYSSDTEELELKEAAVGNEGTVWLLIGKRPWGKLSGSQTISLCGQGPTYLFTNHR